VIRAVLDTTTAAKPPLATPPLSVEWDDVVGLDAARSTLAVAALMPARFPELFRGARRPPRAVLLYGPPGTGKTHLAKALATRAASTFFAISSTDLITKWLGESEQRVRALFERARAARPSIVFIDEIDSLCGTRRDTESESASRVKTEFLTQLDGIASANEGVLVLGATNVPYALDAAVRRRFERRLYIALPDAAARCRMIERRLVGVEHTLAAEDLAALVAATDGYSGADLDTLVRDALLAPVRDIINATHFRALDDAGDGAVRYEIDNNADGVGVVTTWESLPPGSLSARPLTAGDIESALARTRPSVAAADIAEYERFTAEFGERG